MLERATVINCLQQLINESRTAPLNPDPTDLCRNACEMAGIKVKFIDPYCVRHYPGIVCLGYKLYKASVLRRFSEETGTFSEETLFHLACILAVLNDDYNGSLLCGSSGDQEDSLFIQKSSEINRLYLLLKDYYES